MLKFIHLFKNYYLGLSFIGIAAFVLQEIPYIVMPIIKPACNPIMNMQNEIRWIEPVQGLFGTLSMILLMLVVRDDVKLIPRETAKEKIFLFISVDPVTAEKQCSREQQKKQYHDTKDI